MTHGCLGLPGSADPSGGKEPHVTELSPPREDERDWHIDEQRRLALCAAEPIRTPGRIQGHGTLLGIDEPTQTVVLASENADHWLGRRLRDLGSEGLTWTGLHG